MLDNSNIKNMVNIAKITSASSTPQIKTFDNEIIDKVPYYQQAGIASIPLNDTTVLIICPNGDKSNPVIVGDNTQSPITLQPGEAIIYTDENNYIHVKVSGDIEVKTGTLKMITGNLTLDAGDIEATVGDIIAAAGDVSDSGATTPSMQDIRDLFNAHTHPTAPVGPISPPSSQM